jgi:hypothetical protein
MHIITVCPRCNEDFMYHASDSHLFRDETIVDEVGNNEVVETVICQDCCQKEVVKIIEESKREVYLVNANEVVDTRNPLLIDESGHWNFPRPKMYSEEEVIELLQKALTHRDDRETGSLVTAQGEIRTANFFSWFERFKKK